MLNIQISALAPQGMQIQYSSILYYKYHYLFES